ncbi:DUF5329 domain-containing protein [Chitinibacter tainanensis]|uniref:DUF5329 domain-containing protein n=1 Tax=Chitinibacter tainanensis TaxID=230667 RepID=UPI002354F854|nr:DUF5329 domain-containing protein [Chitinibacter tainanensis]
MMRRGVCTLALLASLPAQAITPAAEQEVQALLRWVGQTGCTFIRSGSSYDAKAAQEHLTMKYGKARDKIKTTEDFINEVASKSYLTGQPYTVRCANQAEQPAKNWLYAELKRQRSKTSP